MGQKNASHSCLHCASYQLNHFSHCMRLRLQVAHSEILKITAKCKSKECDSMKKTLLKQLAKINESIVMNTITMIYTKIEKYNSNNNSNNTNMVTSFIQISIIDSNRKKSICYLDFLPHSPRSSLLMGTSCHIQTHLFSMPI